MDCYFSKFNFIVYLQKSTEHISECLKLIYSHFLFSKMINLSEPDTIDERAINKKKLTPFTISVSIFPLLIIILHIRIMDPLWIDL